MLSLMLSKPGSFGGVKQTLGRQNCALHMSIARIRLQLAPIKLFSNKNVHTIPIFQIDAIIILS